MTPTTTTFTPITEEALRSFGQQRLVITPETITVENGEALADLVQQMAHEIRWWRDSVPVPEVLRGREQGDAKRRAILAALYRGEEQRSPLSIRALARRIGCSTTTAHYHLGILIRQGRARRIPNARGYQTTAAGRRAVEALATAS